jgi:hypothetical protein
MAGIPYRRRFLGREISRLTRYYDCVVQYAPREEDPGHLLAVIDAPQKGRIEAGQAFPDLSADVDRRTAVLLNGTANYDFDIEGTLGAIRARLARTSRLLLVIYNPYLRALYSLATRMGLRSGEQPTTFVTRLDLQNLARLSGFEIVREQPAVYCPWRLAGLGTLVNRLLPAVPFVRWLGLTYVVVLRPLVPTVPSGLTCVIPARNERGNIENALRRFPDLGCTTEIVFVEGHSTDGTWDEIQRVAREHSDRFRIVALQQTGKGKADAVRLGFARASQELLTILDADLTMPPELLHRFYDAYCAGHGDFVNGSRLVYPMEGEAMRFLNRLGNVFFAKALSAVLGARFSDSLCGTKLLARHDYERMVRWRRDFGDFDPFGDFELLFPAAVLALGSVDVPVRYRARTYGSTNIRRFAHGLELLRMTAVGFWRIKLGFGS